MKGLIMICLITLFIIKKIYLNNIIMNLKNIIIFQIML
jgi:hypothetical protein